MTVDPDKETADLEVDASDDEDDAAEEATTDVHDRPETEPADDDPDADEEEPTQEASRPDSPAAPAPKSQAVGLRVARVLLAPVLAAGAVGVHFWLNVPEHPVVVQKPRKGGRTRAKRKPPERNPQQMQVSWDRWSVQPYDGEPIKGKWGRQMQGLMNRAVVVARKFAFADSPEAPRVVAVQTQCRTIRCRFVLRSPYKHETTLIADTLQHINGPEVPLFRHVEHEFIDPPGEGMPKDDHYLQVTVGINVDGVLPNEIEVDPEYAETFRAKKPDPAPEDEEGTEPADDDPANDKGDAKPKKPAKPVPPG